MNERINALRLDAGIAQTLNDPRLIVIDKTGSVINPIVGLEKFAELIVQECLDIMSNADMTDLEGPDPEDVLYVASKQIKKHFGVK